MLMFHFFIQGATKLFNLRVFFFGIPLIDVYSVVHASLTALKTEISASGATVSKYSTPEQAAEYATVSLRNAINASFTRK